MLFPGRILPVPEKYGALRYVRLKTLPARFSACKNCFAVLCYFAVPQTINIQEFYHGCGIEK